jgi:D-alanyl-D-alanine carboxypeptidase (penicillin-binding protein 5/6)
MKRFILKRRRFFILFAVIALLAVIGTGAYMQYSRPIPEVTIAQASPMEWTSPSEAEIPWPELGQAAVSVAGVDIIGESPDQAPMPIASLAKIMTAYLILKNHPLEPGQPGPDIQFTEAHVADYHARKANGESVVLVRAGDTMTEREMLRGLMLASGNNIADILAEWHSGSVEAFVAEMNQEARDLGMTSTTYADAAGLSPESRSTASDQMRLAIEAMKDPTFASVVGEVDANLPGAGIVYNTNSELGQNGIVGVKTGWTEDAGACFVFAADWQIADQTVQVIGAVMGQYTLADAFDRSRELIAVGGTSVQLLPVAASGDVVGVIHSEWGEQADAVLTQDVSLLVVPGAEVTTDYDLVTTADIEEGDEVGSITYTAGGQSVEVPLEAGATVKDPDLLWRLTRIQ